MEQRMRASRRALFYLAHAAVALEVLQHHLRDHEPWGRAVGLGRGDLLHLRLVHGATVRAYVHTRVSWRYRLASRSHQRSHGGLRRKCGPGIDRPITVRRPATIRSGIIARRRHLHRRAVTIISRRRRIIRRARIRRDISTHHHSIIRHVHILPHRIRGPQRHIRRRTRTRRRTTITTTTTMGTARR